MNLKGKRFLVTGGAGFVGSHLVQRLLDEDVKEVVIFDNFIRGGFHNLEDIIRDDRARVFEVKGDITRLDEIDRATKKVDGVFHMASLCLAHCQDFPRSSLDVNIAGTFNLLEACVKNNVRRVIFSSSSSVYGNACYSPIDEKHPFENRNFYGASKIAGESILRAFFYKFNLGYLALRYMNIYGPRQDYFGVYVAIIMKVIDRLQQGLPPIIYGDGTQAFDFIYVKDICEANILAMTSNKNDRAYNISTGVQTSINELTKLIMHIMEKGYDIVYIPTDDNALVTNRIGSVLKAKKELHFVAKTSLDDGLQATIQWKLSKDYQK